jgi:galactokinase
MAERLRVSAPGRICLFGEHQDFLGLEVIAAAVNLRIEVAGAPREGREFRLAMPDVGDEDAFDPNQPQEPRGPRDYLRQAANVLRKEGVRWRQGYACTIHGEIPINAGCSSSSALTVAWAAFLLEAAGAQYAPGDVARLAHRAEVVEFGEPGGMMDHYTSSLGGLLHVDCRDPIAVTPLAARPSGLVLGDSLEKKETTAVLARSKEDVLEGVARLREMLPGFDLRETPLAEAVSQVARLPRRVARKAEANLINRDIARLGLEMLRDPKGFDPQGLGRLLSAHHHELSAKLGVSTGKIDGMCRAALAAGALGAKMNGSGGGGTMFAFAPGREDQAAQAIEQQGGKAYQVTIDDGLRVERKA